MALRRRTLSVFLILLSLNSGLVLVACYAVGPGISYQPVLTEYCPSSETPTPQLVKSLLTVASAKGVLTEILPVVQMIFPETQQLSLNDVLSFGPFPQGMSINTVSPSNYAASNPNCVPICPTSSTYVSPIEVSNSLQAQSVINTLANPSQIESLTVIDQNYSPVTQIVQVKECTPTANVAKVYQTPITVQIPSMPLLSPFIAVATPLPEKLPSHSCIQKICRPVCPQILDTEITTVTSVPVEITTGQQLPVTLQFNTASPCVPEPVVNVISSPQPAVPSSPCNNYPAFGIPPYPIVVMEKSRCRWKSILPILMLTLFDSGSSNNGGCCCCNSQCGASTMYPFPIVIPTNNPIICGGSRGKGKSKTSSGCQN